MIRMTDAQLVADELRTRYEPLRAMTLLARMLNKALFAGRSDEVVFWALVHAYYRGGQLSESTHEQLAAFRELILPASRDVY